MRLISHVILAAAVSVSLVGCDKGTVTPATPTTTQQQPTLPNGDYTVTVTADPACTNLPAALRTRTYRGSLASDAGGAFRLVLGEGEMVPSQSVAFGNLRNTTVTIFVSSEELFLRWLEDWPIVERLPNVGALSFYGRAEGTLRPENATINAAFDGVIAYCSAATIDTTIDNVLLSACKVPLVECRSGQHLVLLDRR